MESLQEILSRRDFKPPDEIETIKQYILRRYGSKSSVKIQRGALVVSVRSSALAATLQLERRRLIEACRLTKKLIIRSG